MSHRAHVGPEDLFEAIGEHQFETMKGLAKLRKDHYVLDYGCGCLRAGQYLIPWLYKGRYFGVEISKSQVVAGIKTELNGDLSKEPAFSFMKPDTFGVPNGYMNGSEQVKRPRYFDRVLLHSILTHASLEQCYTLLRSIHANIRGGILMATVNIGEEDYAGETWQYPGAHYFRKLTVLAMFKNCGYRTVELLPAEETGHPSGQTWVVAQR